MDALERQLARQRGEARSAADGLSEPNRTQPLRGTPAPARPARCRAQLLHHRGPRLRGHELRGRCPLRLLRELGAGARHLRELALQGGRRRPARRLVAARGPVRDRLAMLKLGDDFHSPTLIQHIAARWLAAGAHDRYVESTLLFTGSAATPSSRRSMSPGEYRADIPQCMATTWGVADAAARRAQLYSGGGGASRRGVHAWRRQTAERRSQVSRPSSSRCWSRPVLDEGVRRLARAIREVRRRSRHAVAAPMS